MFLVYTVQFPYIKVAFNYYRYYEFIMAMLFDIMYCSRNSRIGY